jgi:hypothetical protein
MSEDLIIIAIVFAIYMVPTVSIVRRSGLSPWWSILAFIPLINIIALWVFAFCKWPALREEKL